MKQELVNVQVTSCVKCICKLLPVYTDIQTGTSRCAWLSFLALLVLWILAETVTLKSSLRVSGAGAYCSA